MAATLEEVKGSEDQGVSTASCRLAVLSSQQNCTRNCIGKLRWTELIYVTAEWNIQLKERKESFLSNREN
jgi:hypothetical protein